MKIRTGFVSNSSSSSFTVNDVKELIKESEEDFIPDEVCEFTIVNGSNSTKTIIDFAKETSYLCKKSKMDCSENDFIKDAINRQINGKGFSLRPNEWVNYKFDDSDTFGIVCSRKLFTGGKTDSFAWEANF